MRGVKNNPGEGMMGTSGTPASVHKEGKCSAWREQRTKHSENKDANHSPWATPIAKTARSPQEIGLASESIQKDLLLHRDLF